MFTSAKFQQHKSCCCRAQITHARAKSSRQPPDSLQATRIALYKPQPRLHRAGPAECALSSSAAVAQVPAEDQHTQHRWSVRYRPQQQQQIEDLLQSHHPQEVPRHSQTGILQDRTALEAGFKAKLNSIAHSHSEDQPYIPADTAAGRNRQITAHISKRKHWTQLQQIWLDNSEGLTPIHLTAILTRLARLVESNGVAASDRPELFKFSSAILSSVGQVLDVLDPRGAAQCFWAYAKLQSISPHSSKAGDAAAAVLAAELAQQHMQHVSPQELSQAAWAAAILQPAGLQLPAQWWPQFEHRLLLMLPTLQPSEVACCTWAAATTGHRLPEQVTTAILQHTIACIEAYSIRELVQISTAAAGWGIALPRDWMTALSSRLQALAPTMQPLDISSSLLALSQLHRLANPFAAAQADEAIPAASTAAVVPRRLVKALLQRCMQELPCSCPRALVSVPYALVKLGTTPGPTFWASYLPYAAASLHCCDPPGLAILAWSLGRFGINPGSGWVQEFVVQAGSKIQGFGPQELSMLAWGLGRWGAEVSEHWWQGFEQVSGDQMDNFTAAELSALLHGIAGTTVPAGGSAAAAVPTGTTSVSEASNSGLAQTPADTAAGPAAAQQQQQQQQLLHSFSKPWTAKLLAATESSLPGAPADPLAGLITGLAKLNIRPSSSWLASFEAAAVAAAPGASLGHLASTLWAYAVLEVQPSSALLRVVYSRIQQLLQAVVQLDSSGRSTVAPPIAKPTAVAHLLWAVANLRTPVGAPWIDDVLQAAAPGLSKASSYTLVTMIRALAKLGHAPGCKAWVDVWWAAYAVQLQKLQRQYECSGDECSVDSSSSSSQQQRHTQQYRRLPVQRCSLQHYPGADYTHPCGGIAAVLWSFSRLRVAPHSSTSPDDNWLQLLLDVSQSMLCTASVMQLWGLLSQLAHWHVWPGHVWLASAAEAVSMHQQRLLQERQRQQGVLTELQQREWGALRKCFKHLNRLTGMSMGLDRGQP